MTSKIFSFNQLKELLKRHLTSVLILGLACVIHFISVFLNFENIIEYAEIPFPDYIIERIASLFSANIVNGIFAFAIGAFFAFDYFKYLHSKKQTDFYESLPITRRNRFFMNFISGFSIYALFVFVTLFAESFFVTQADISVGMILSKVFWNYVCMLCIYLISWVTAALAMIMTGHSIVALLGFGAFNVYFPILLHNLIPTFSNIYFETYVSLPTFTKFNVLSTIKYISPASLLYKLIYIRRDFWTFADHKYYLLGALLFTVIIGFIAYVLFEKRSAETAGRAMAFEKANSLIRIMLVVPISLYIGVFLKSMSVNEADGWLIFGIIFAGFVVHGLLQAIFESDIKAMFSKKKQLIFTYVLTLLFFAVFKFDFFHFDEYIPKLDQVKSIIIETDDFNDAGPLQICDGISGDKKALALEAAKEIVLNDDGLYIDYDSRQSGITFEYELNNGLIVSRRYTYLTNDVPESLNEISLTEEFKDDYLILYWKDQFDEVKFTYDYDKYFPIEGEVLKKLLETYKEEYSELSFVDIYSEPVVYRFYASDGEDPFYEDTITNSYSPLEIDYYESYHSYNFNVYESFSKTIEILNEIGYVSFAQNDELTIKHLEVYDEKEDETAMTITDEEILTKLKPYSYLSDFNHNLNNQDYVLGFARIESSTNEYYNDIYIERDIFESIVK